jgi:glycosyltransferase involved in cell wall biosynthesis
MPKLSVIICTHNPRGDYFSRVLAALRAQSLPRADWELIIVDNASAAPVAKDWDISWHENAHHVSESRIGLAFARQRGISVATADVVVFVDDDNVLDSEYLARCVEIAREWPRLGVWGSGSLIPEFEIEPEQHLRPYLNTLALRETTQNYWSNVATCRESSPCGAGMCVRSDLARDYMRHLAKDEIQISGRTGTSLLSGDDIEICFMACDSGYGVGVFPELRLIHLIPERRVSEAYMISLCEAITASMGLLTFKQQGSLPLNPLSFASILSIIRNGLLLRGIERKMYMAAVRGNIKARKMIANYRPTA